MGSPQSRVYELKGEIMIDRHVRTKQRAPSIRSIIARLEKMLEIETSEEGRILLQRGIDYWKGQQRHRSKGVES